MEKKVTKDTENSHSQWIKKMNESIESLQTKIKIAPIIQLERQQAKEGSEARRRLSKELFHQIFFFSIMVSLIPILMFLWNSHIVLGILGLATYVWLVKNKLESGYYFG